MNAFIFLFVTIFLVGPARGRICAQYMTNNSQSDQFLADVVDGGPAASGFTTRIRMTNTATLTSTPATGFIIFYGDDGHILPLDFGSGPNGSMSISVPPGGTITMESKGGGSTIVQGWAEIQTDTPVQVTAEFRNFQNGVQVNAASVNGVPPAMEYWYPVDSFSGIAVGNPDPNNSIGCVGQLRDTSGTVIATKSWTLGPDQHTAFNVSSLPGVSASTTGSFLIACADSSANRMPVISLGINGNNRGITSSLPDSSMTTPVRHHEDIAKAVGYVLKIVSSSPALATYAPLLGTPNVGIVPGGSVLTCYTAPFIVVPGGFCAGVLEVLILSASLGDVMNDSPAELAFVVGHEFGHIVQHHLSGASTSGFKQIFPSSATNTDLETDADIFAIMVLIAGRYDPYAAGGALGKLATVSAIPNFPTFEPHITIPDMHASLASRVGVAYAMISQACSTLPPAACQTNHTYVNPDLPPGTP